MTFNRTVVRLGDLIAALYDEGRSTMGVFDLLAPQSPLSMRLDRRILVVA
jgi:hypothetical protein